MVIIYEPIYGLDETLIPRQLKAQNKRIQRDTVQLKRGAPYWPPCIYSEKIDAEREREGAERGHRREAASEKGWKGRGRR